MGRVNRNAKLVKRDMDREHERIQEEYLKNMMFGSDEEESEEYQKAVSKYFAEMIDDIRDEYIVDGALITCSKATDEDQEIELGTEKETISPLPIPRDILSGCSFDAVVTDVNKDMVQLDIAQDEWNASDGRKWFMYSTVYSSPDGTGWYCMPEKGDSVRLFVPEKEEDSFVMSAVHKETDSARCKPEHKSFKTKHGKEILFTPDSILMTNNQGMMVEMNDSEGIKITSDKDILIEAQDNLTIASSDASLLIAADDAIKVKQGATSMTLSDDISFTGGEFRIQ